MAVPGRVVAVGAVNRDLVASVARLPAPGETVTARRISRWWGGKAANAAVAAARLDADTVLICAVGDDDEGVEAIGELRRAGVRVRADRVAEPTGTAMILVDARGENAIAVQPGANGVLGAGHVAAVLARLALTGDDVLVLSGEAPTAALLAAATAAAAAGATVLVNPSPVPAGGIEPGLLAARRSLVVVNEPEQALLGADGTGADLVVTLGARGAVLRTSDGARRELPGLAVTAVDSTGAGDAFLGACAAELARGVPLPAALAAAVRAGAYAVTGPGARHHATRADLRRLGT